MPNSFSIAVTINSIVDDVWSTLTEPVLMTEWMGGPEMELSIDTNWKINSHISIHGSHHVKFENKGIVLEFVNGKKLKYSHLSSLSRLPDKPENYSNLTFILTPAEQKTELTLTIENFPTESVRKHLEFYWRNTILIIKKSVEEYTNAQHKS